MKLNSFTLRALALGCTALIPIAAAQAQTGFQITSGVTTSTQTVSAGGTGELGQNAYISVGTGDAIDAVDSTAAAINQVIIHGVVWVYGAGYGVDLGQYSELLLGSTGTIQTSTASSYGINADIHTEMTINGDITTSGTSGIGIYAADATSVAEQVKIVVAGTGSVTTSGASAHGIYLGDYGKLTLDDGATITTTNTSTNFTEGAYGIYAQDNTTIDSAADITTSGTYSHGIRLNGTGNVLTTSGDIVTSGDSAYGISVASATSVANQNSVTVKGKISTTGASADAIVLGNYGSLTIASGASVTAGDNALVLGTNTQVANHGTLDSGDGMAAVYVIGSGNSFVSDGDILGYILEVTGTSNNNSYTIGTGGSVSSDSTNAFSLNSNGGSKVTIEDGATVTATGTGISGIDFTSGNTANNAGIITVSGSNSYGIWLKGTGNVVTNSGTISTDGPFGHGIYAASGTSSTSYNQIVIEDGGTVETSGDDAYGIWLGDYGRLEIQAGGHVATDGDNAYGVYAGSSTTITNASTTIATTGDGAHGIVLSGGGNVVSQVGAITTEGAGAYGIYAADLVATDTANDITMLDGDSITTKGASSYGIWLGDYGQLTLEDGATIATSGDYADGVLAGNNTSISIGGDITTSGYNSNGLYTTSPTSVDDQTTVVILGSGSISTSGEESYGILLGDYGKLALDDGAKITTGDVNKSSLGTGSHGISAGKNTKIDNAGDITTYGAGAHGIFFEGTGNELTHSGTIATSGADSYAIYAAAATSSADANQIFLTGGTVSTKGHGSLGIFLDKYAELTVGSGASILTEGEDAHAVYMKDSAVLTNSGTIRATGTNGVGVYALTNTVITNSGTIEGDDYAIWLAGAGNTVNFMEGMSLVGDVRVDDADNTFVFGEDLNAAITVSGVLPSNVSGEDFLLCDPTYYVEEGISGSCVIFSTDVTGFAMLDEMLDDATGPAFEAVGKRLKRRLARGGDADVAVDEGLMIAPAGDDLGRAPAVWAKSYGSYRDQDAWGDIGASRHGLGGLVSGIDGRVGTGLRAGVLMGATTGTLSSASQDTGWQSLYGGVYAGREVGARSVVGLTVLAGGAWYDSDRTILDNTSATGQETASADYTAAFVSPELSLSTALSVANLRIAGRYAGLFVGDYEEEGSSSDLAVDARTIHVAGVGATLGIPHAMNASLAVEPYVGLEGRYASSRDVAVEAVSFGQSIMLDADGDKTVGRLYAGAGADYASEDGALSVKLSLRGTLDSDGTRAAEASLGGELRF